MSGSYIYTIGDITDESKLIGMTGPAGKSFTIFATIDSSMNTNFSTLDPSNNHIGEFILDGSGGLWYHDSSNNYVYTGPIVDYNSLTGPTGATGATGPNR
jgi:hypothetical protein